MDGGLTAAVWVSPPLHLRMDDFLSNRWGPPHLIGNAIKYRKSGVPPVVLVSAKRRTPYWEFSIEDNGIGIDPKYAETIFVIFKRLHSSEEYPGTGLGLAICQRIVEQYDGRIWVESKLSKGSVFRFIIPD
jgi:light-regulated signal transduction histidine kinase (bacteriophytochrome)